MDNWETLANKLVSLMGFHDYRVEVKPEEKYGAIFIYDGGNFIKEQLPVFVDSLNHLLQMIAKKTAVESIFFDINNYREERKNLITELARAAAKKATATKTEVPLPAMNSYERRLVHVALAVHPEVTTESMGDGKERYVIIKPISSSVSSSGSATATAEENQEPNESE